MTTNLICRSALAAILAVCALTIFAGRSIAQERSDAAQGSRERADINYEVQMHLLVASNDAAGGIRLPTDLQPLVKQLRASLPYDNYALGVTFINRVKDGGNLEVKGVANALLSAPAGSNPASFYDFTLWKIKLETDAQGREVIQVPTLRFGMRVPIQTATVPGTDGKGGYPVINYEPIGLTTSVSFREGVPVVIGTLTTNRTDQLMVLAAQIKRTDAR